MSWKCSWFSCDLIQVKNLDGEGHYILTRCVRCWKEEVRFIREDVVQPHTKDTLKLVRKCMTDPHFVKCCIRYRKFREIIKMDKGMLREAALTSFYKEYNMEPVDRVPDPMLLFGLKRWHIYENHGEKKSGKRNNSSKTNEREQSSAAVQPPPVPPVVQQEKKKKKVQRPSIQRLREMSYDELDRFLWKCVEKEEYEKAAFIKREMDRRTGLSD